MGFQFQVAHIGANDFAKARAVIRHGYIFWTMLLRCFIADNFLIGYRLPVWLGGGADIQLVMQLFYFLIFSNYSLPPY